MRVMSTPYAGVICPFDGPVDIDRINYLVQMSNPDAPWKCPKCGAISEFNDERYEELHPEPTGE